LRLLGRVKNVSHEGKLIVKADFAPAENALVVDGRKRKIGKVIKIFGPVRAPYVAIRPMRGQRALTIIGQELYIPPEGEHGKAKRRDGADRKMSRMQ